MNQNISALLKSTAGRVLISIILGVGLSALFRKACRGADCIEFVAPPDSELREGVFRYGDKCMEYKPRATECSKNRVKVRMG